MTLKRLMFKSCEVTAADQDTEPKVRRDFISMWMEKKTAIKVISMTASNAFLCGLISSIQTFWIFMLDVIIHLEWPTATGQQ